MRYRWLLATLWILSTAPVQAQVTAPEAPGGAMGTVLGAVGDLSGIWAVYGWACGDGRPMEARAEVRHSGNLIAVIMLEGCSEHAQSADKVHMTGYVDPERGSILFQKIDYDYRNGNPKGSRLRSGHIFADGRIILLQENNWRERYFMVRLDG